MIVSRSESLATIARSRPAVFAVDGSSLRASFRGTPTAQILAPKQRAAARAKRKAQRQARKRSR